MLSNDSGHAVLHFGLPKTGSTSIQLSLFRHLSDPRFHYVSFGNAKVNYVVATGFKDDPGRFLFHARRGTSSDELQRLRKSAADSLQAELLCAGKKTAILSAESISSFKKSEFRDLCSALAKQRQAVRAVGYVRRPKEFAESAFQQRIKNGGLFDLSKLFPNFRARLDKFDTVLGRENVQIWLFDPASFPGQCVVQDFCSRLGIAFRPEDVIRANEGLSLPALSLLFAYRKFGPGFGRGPTVLLENTILVTKMRSLPGPKLRLHSTLLAPVIEARRKSIGWMEERLGASLAEDLAAHDQGAIRTEEDMLKFEPESLRWLAGELGDDYVRRWHPRMSPREVAEWMHILRVKITASDKRLKAAASQNPVRKVFQHISRRIRKLATGPFRGNDEAVKGAGRKTRVKGISPRVAKPNPE